VLFLGYKLWGANGLCFRLVNMGDRTGLWTELLGLVVLDLNKTSAEQSSFSKEKMINLGPIFRCAVILYPLHSESVTLDLPHHKFQLVSSFLVDFALVLYKMAYRL